MTLDDAIKERLDDLRDHHIRLWERDIVIESIVLTYLSARVFYLGRKKCRGYIESLIVGDTGCGKSHALRAFGTLVNKGQLVNGSNLSKVGIEAGVQTIGGTQYVSFGACPRNHRGLMAIEELSRVDVPTIGSWTDMRSSGVARCTKIVADEAPAETRKIFVSNPRYEKAVKDFAYGPQIVEELVGAARDIRRFDIILLTKRKPEITQSVVQERGKEADKRTARWSARDWTNLVSFAWSLEPENVHFTDEAIDAASLHATETTEKWGSDFPIALQEEQMDRVARLAIPYAVMTYNFKDGILSVTEEHVHQARRFLDRMYEDPGLDMTGYLRMQRSRDTLGSEARQKMLETGITGITPTTLHSLLAGMSIECRELGDSVVNGLVIAGFVRKHEDRRTVSLRSEYRDAFIKAISKAEGVGVL